MRSIPVTATGTVHAGVGRLVGARLAAGSDTAVATIHDGTSAAGPIVARLSAVANTADECSPSEPIHVVTGVHVVLSGTNAHLNVWT